MIYALCYFTYGYDEVYAVHSIHLEKPDYIDMNGRFWLEVKEGDSLQEGYDSQILTKDGIIGKDGSGNDIHDMVHRYD